MCKKGDAKNNIWGVHLTNNHLSLKEFQSKLQVAKTIEREVAEVEETHQKLEQEEE